MNSHKHFFLLLFTGIIILFAAKNTHSQTQKINPHDILEIEKGLMGEEIGKIKSGDWQEHYIIKDSLFESEGVEWPTLVFLHPKTKDEMLYAETNWENNKIISRITFLDPSLKIYGSISVGSDFKSIKSKIDPNRLNDYPDGYCILYEKEKTNIAYIMDITDYPQFYYGVSSFESIPDDLRVKEIVLNGLRK